MMNRRSVISALLQTGLLAVTGPVRGQQAPRVIFLNPGDAEDRGTGPYWRLVSDSMDRAAQVFGFQLEIIYCHREHLRMLRQAEEIANWAHAPDYVIIVNEKLAAQQMLQTLSRSRAKILLIHNDLTAEQRHEIGNERQHFANWIGTVAANSRRGAYLLLERLHHRLGDHEPLIVAISGDPTAPVSLERAEGVKEYMGQAGRGRIHQFVFGDWSYADGENKAALLLARYPNTNIIWTASDSLALGALRAVKVRGASVLVGGMGGWPIALLSVAEDGLTATAAGSFLVGAWAIVMLYDYHNGEDFAEHGGASQNFDYFIVSKENVAQYDAAVMKRRDMLDFRSYSKVFNPQPGRYDFSLGDFLPKPKAP